MPEMQQRGSLVSHSAVSLTSNSSEPTHGEPDAHGPQSLPPWIHTNDGGVSSGDAHAFPQAPDRTVPNSRHYKPPPTHYKPGRKWDHLRSASPPLLSAPIAEHQERWRDFMHAGPNYVEQQAQTRVVDQAWLDEHMPYLNQQWTEQEEAEAALEKAKETTGFSGLMYGGKWLISPERQERTVRLFSVSQIFVLSISRADEGPSDYYSRTLTFLWLSGLQLLHSLPQPSQLQLIFG